MSWSLERKGQAKQVLESVNADFDRMLRMNDPEETIKNLARQQIVMSLNQYHEHTAVHVKAFGSMSQGSDGKGYNNFSVSVEPIYGFEPNKV